MVDAAVIGGKERWRDRLNELSESLTAQRAGLDEDSERATFDKRIEALNGLIEIALPLIEFLEELPVKAKCGDSWIIFTHLRIRVWRIGSDR